MEQVEQVEQVESESAVADEGGTADSPGRRTGARDGGAGGAGRARVRRGIRRRVGLGRSLPYTLLYGKVVRIRSDARL